MNFWNSSRAYVYRRCCYAGGTGSITPHPDRPRIRQLTSWRLPWGMSCGSNIQDSDGVNFGPLWAGGAKWSSSRLTYPETGCGGTAARRGNLRRRLVLCAVSLARQLWRRLWVRGIAWRSSTSASDSPHGICGVVWCPGALTLLERLARNLRIRPLVVAWFSDILSVLGSQCVVARSGCDCICMGNPLDPVRSAFLRYRESSYGGGTLWTA